MRARFVAAIVTSVLLAACSASDGPTNEPTAGLPITPAPSVAADVSAVPSAPASAAPGSAEPTVAPSSSPSTSSLAWNEVARKSSAAVAGFSGGYVALANQDVDSKVLYSADGVSWTSVSLPFPSSKDSHGNVLGAFTEAIASNGPQVIVVGGYSHTPCTKSTGGTGGGPLCPSSPITWTTSDGTHWHSSYPWPGPGPAVGTQGNEFLAVWSIPGGGWDAAGMDVSGEAGTSDGLFHSTDGLKWAKVSSPSPDHAGADRLELWHLGLADATGRRLIGGYWYPSGNSLLGLFTSADGKAWSSVKTFNGADTSVGSGVAPIDSLRPLWVIAGTDTNSLPTVWTSPDLVTWTAHELPTLPGAQGSVSTVAATHLGYVAAGQLSDGTDGSAYHSSWVSVDGQSWTQIDTPGTPDGDGPDVITDGPGGVVGFAWYNGSDTPVGVWQLK